MKNLFLTTLLAIPAFAFAYIPPDYYGEPENKDVGWWVNDGQLLDTDGNTIPYVLYSSQGSFPRLYFQEESIISFVVRDKPVNNTLSNLLYRIDMFLGGEASALRDPTVYHVKDQHLNFYLPHCMPGITNVQGYSRLVYHDVYPDIDLHFYGGSGGQKMAFVCKEGSDPSNIMLMFSGQDQLDLDVNGFLEMYIGQEVIKLPEAVAYQDVNGTVVPLSWNAEYNVNNGTSTVQFLLGSYDPAYPVIFQVGPAPATAAPPAQGLEWSTLLGSLTLGGGEAYVNAADAADDGDILVAGNTNDMNFPANTGTTPHAGVHDVVVGRFKYAPGNPNDDAELDYMTYFGGTGIDRPKAAHMMRNGSAFVVGGWTNSPSNIEWPSSDPSDGTYWQGTLKGPTDGFLAWFDPVNGTRLRSTYYGGEGEETINALAENEDAHVYFGGITTTAQGNYDDCNSPATGFPMCDANGTTYQQDVNGGGQDGFFGKIDADYALLWSTMFGEAGDEEVYDVTYASEGNVLPTPSKRIVFVGSTDAGLPNIGGGSFALGSHGQTSGFIATFDLNEEQKWTTTVHGVLRLSSSAVIGRNLTVMGITHHNQTTVDTCDAVAGELSTCNGGSGYFDNTVETYDEYFARFLLPNGNMVRSTVYGGPGWETAEHTDTLLYTALQYDPFGVYRYSDLEIDTNGNMYALGIYEHGNQIVNDMTPTQYHWGLYNKPWADGIGTDQTEMTVKGFAPDGSLFWCSHFGSEFDHVGGPQDYFNYDYPFLHRGCDFGHELVLVPGQALYWAGSSGGGDYDDECPYPGTSWCEPPMITGGGGDLMLGFTARMDLNGVMVQVSELTMIVTQTLTVSPNPTMELLSIHGIEKLIKPTVFIHDALGKLVMNAQLSEARQVNVSALAAGTYSISIFDNNELMGVGRFAKQ